MYVPHHTRYRDRRCDSARYILGFTLSMTLKPEPYLPFTNNAGESRYKLTSEGPERPIAMVVISMHHHRPLPIVSEFCSASHIETVDSEHAETRYRYHAMRSGSS
jgi:hypothetical protein